MRSVFMQNVFFYVIKSYGGTHKMEIKKWKQEEIEFLKENFDKYTIKELANKLDVTVRVAQNMARKLGLAKHVRKAWTTEEDNYLRENYLSMTAKEMAKYLNRGLMSVQGRLQNLNLTKENMWTDEEEKFLVDNYQYMTNAAIGKILNRTESSVEKKCSKMGLIINDPWSEEEDKMIKELYEKKSYKEIGKLLNRTRCAVQHRARRLGLEKPNNFCNYRFFESIDTEEKAYWLGFFAADGWVHKYKNKNGAVVGIKIQYNDINHLKKFNKCIEGNYKISDDWTNCSISTKDKNKLNHMCAIKISSIDMYNDLVSHGITSNKTFTFKFPETIPEHLIRHFMRGYFDGDGCLSIKNITPQCYYLSASKQIIYDFKEIIDNIGITSTRMDILERDGCATIWRIWINQGKDKNIVKFLNYLYKDATVYLDRKYEKYIKVLQKYNERLPHQPEMTGSF